MKIITAGFVVALLCTVVLAIGPGGVWKGESICQVKNSPCHDEQVVYHATEPDSSGKFKIQADKIVNGKPEDMGTLDCTYEAKASKVVCPIGRGTFEFTIEGTHMNGTLKLPDGTLYRKITLTKE